MQTLWYRASASSTLVLVLVLGQASPQPLAAADTRFSDKEVLVKADETIADDLYAFGTKVTIDGKIEGDLYAFGNEIVINGIVEGDVIAFGQQITLNGTVKGDVMGGGQAIVLSGSADDVRIAGQVLKLGPKAKLAGSILAAGFSLETEKESTIAGDALFAGFQALLAGQIDKDLKGGLVNCLMEGKVGGDIDLQVDGDESSRTPPSFGPAPVQPATIPGGLTIADTAEVTGKLHYVSQHEAQIAEGAKLTGGVEHSKPKAPPQVAGQPAPPPPNPIVAAIGPHLRHGICVALIGLVALLCCPRWTSNWADNIRTRPAASFAAGGAGLVGFIALLILAVIVIIFAAVVAGLTTLHELVPMVIVGGIVGYAALIVGMWLIASFLAQAMTGLAVGRLALPADSIPVRIGALVLGVIVVTLVLSIPYAGPWIAFVVFLFGLGGFCLWLIGSTPAEETANPTPAPAYPTKPLKA